MALDVATQELGRQDLLVDERIVYHVVAGSQKLTRPNGQQARIARARSDEIDDAAGAACHVER
jgi:hypothetical protein